MADPENFMEHATKVFEIANKTLAHEISRRRFLGAIGAYSATLSPLGSASTRDSLGPIILENANIRYTLSDVGRNLSLIDRHSGHEYLQAETLSSFVTITKAGNTHYPSTCHRDGNRIITLFAELSAVVVCVVRDHGSFFTFDVESFHGEGIEELSLLNLRVTGLPNMGRMANLVWNDQFGLAVIALNLHTKAGCATICDSYQGTDMQPAPPLIMAPSWWDAGQKCNIPARDSSGAIISPPAAILSASCFRKLSIQGASVALLGCPSNDLRNELKSLVKQVGFIQSNVGGAWALDAPQNFGSYLICPAGENDIDDWIELAKSGGFQTIILDKIGVQGHYHPDAKKFPHGMAGIRNVTRKIRAAGLVPAWHTMSFTIQKSDAWVSPTPHPDLAARLTLTHAHDISAGDEFIPVAESPSDLPTQTGFWFRGGMDIAVGDEILTYRGLQTSPPHGLLGCTRGAHGTSAAAHKSGAPLKNLHEVFERYVPAPNSALMEQMQERMAVVIRTCEFEMFYLDGLDGADVFEGADWSWYHGAQFAQGVFRRVGRPVGMEASGWYHHNWHITSRIGTWDGTDRDHKRFIDLHVKNNRQLCELLPKQLGWWKLVHDQGRAGPAVTPDAMEYLCAKGLGYGQPLSLSGVSPAEVKSEPLWSEAIKIMGQFERLRQSGNVPDPIKAKLRVLGDDYHFRQNVDGSAQFVPQAYDTHKWAGIEGSNAPWKVINKFNAQRPRLRIGAMISADSYDSPHARVIADLSDTSEFQARRSAPGVSLQLDPSREKVKSGQISGFLTGQNSLPNRRGAWAMAGKSFEPSLDLTQHPALGVWVFGDSQGQLLNLQIHDAAGPNARVEEHYITVDFSGWRYFELVEPESARWNDYAWPYYEWFAVYGEAVDLAHTTNFNLYYNNLPPSTTTKCWLSPVKALGLRQARLTEMSLAIGNSSIDFPVELKSGSYIECDAKGHGKVFDANGREIGEFRVDACIPILAAGNNTVSFSCRSSSGVNPRVQVTVITSGIPLAI